MEIASITVSSPYNNFLNLVNNTARNTCTHHVMKPVDPLGHPTFLTRPPLRVYLLSTLLVSGQTRVARPVALFLQ